MEGVSLHLLMEVFKTFGFAGLVMMVWWVDSKNIRKILESYKEDVAEIRRMYENNVELVKDYRGLARDLKEVVIMNTQAVTHLADDIEKNQFCPMVRLEKQAKGVMHD